MTNFKSIYYQALKKELPSQTFKNFKKWIDRGSTKKYWENLYNNISVTFENRKKVVVELKKKREEKKTNKLINMLISTENFTDLFDYVRDVNVITHQQAQYCIYAMRLYGAHMAQIKYKAGGEVKTLIRPINDTTNDFYLHVLTKGFYEVVDKAFAQNWSDPMYEARISPIVEITIFRPATPVKKVKNKNGSFFPFINTTDLDLSKYQIYNEAQAKDFSKQRSHCFIHALSEAGVDDALLRAVELSLETGASFAKKHIPTAAKIINKTIVLHFKDTHKARQQVFNKGHAEIHIALHSNHYFIFEKTEYSDFFIKNYNKCKSFNSNQYFKKVKTCRRKINSLNMVESLFRQPGLFAKLDMSMFPEAASHADIREDVYLDKIKNEAEIYEEDNKDNTGKKDVGIFFADCETFVKDNQYHKLYLIGCVYKENDDVMIYNVCDYRSTISNISKEQAAVFAWLNVVTKSGKRDGVVYFHNLKYDFNVLKPYINIKNICKKDGNIYSVKIIYRNRTVELRDSFKLFPYPLSQFHTAFNLPKEYQKKEAINYKYYTEENDDCCVDLDVYRDGLSKKEQDIFVREVKKSKSYIPNCGVFNPTEYYKEYLTLDCLVLKKGIEVFNNVIQEITKGKCSVYESLTISSLIDKFLFKEGCYNGVCKVKGNLRNYISKAITGGRVHANEKYKKKIIKGKIADYDGVSLYPSAISRLCREKGLPLGKPDRYNKDELKDWKNKLYSILTIKINKVNKKQQMPFISYKNDSGELVYTNTAPEKELYMDNITLEDLIKFHKIEYEIIDGIYWNNGANDELGKVIERLFNRRKEEEVKHGGSTPLSNTIKLMLNSCYGKNIMKKTKTRTKIINAVDYRKDNKTNEWIRKDRKDRVESHISNNYNTISKVEQINDNNYEIEELTVDDSYNRAHIGCAILSMSKRIMNEVFNVANDNDLPIYYTDTDSMHLNFDDVSTLETKYEEIYNKKLNGKQLEQFHVDFKLAGAKDAIYATKSIFLGKKSYIDVLESKDEKGNTINGYHYRLKGITKEGLEHVSKKYSNTFEGIYEDLAKGVTMEIPLNPYNPEEGTQKPLFVYENNHVRVRDEKDVVSRTVSF